jgi:hypothetical protein
MVMTAWNIKMTISARNKTRKKGLIMVYEKRNIIEQEEQEGRIQNH